MIHIEKFKENILLFNKTEEKDLFKHKQTEVITLPYCLFEIKSSLFWIIIQNN